MFASFDQAEYLMYFDKVIKYKNVNTYILL